MPSKVLDKITYPFPNIKGETVDVLDRMFLESSSHNL